MKQESDLELRAISDLMIARLRQLFGLPYLGSDNTPPKLINDAFMFDGPNTVNALFSKSRLDGYQCQFPFLKLWIAFDSLHGFEAEKVINLIDETSAEVTARQEASDTIARLIFQFDFGDCKPVNRDIRLVHLAPILETFPGRLIYTPPDRYPVKTIVDEWNPHPVGIELAWEGEYIFERPIEIYRFDDLLWSKYNSKLRLDYPTRLPETQIDNALCRFALTSRFY